MSSQAKKVKNQILASKISVIRSLNNEQALKYELTQFFQNLKKSVLNELEEFYSEDFMFQAHADLILAPIFEAQHEYYNILRKFNHKEYNFGRKEGRRLVKLARKKANRSTLTYADKAKTPSIMNASIEKDELFGTNPWSEQRLLNQSFTASERTMNRIDSDINKILSDGYRNGKGINSVRNGITKRFDQLSSWEAQRIARTEIHNAHNMGTMDIYQEMGVEYTQWIAAHDARTRTSHLDVDREIIPMGGTYSNDLRYPGDTSGPLKEWINCRCSNAPFIIPYGYMAPSFAPFKEKDLIPTLDYWNPPRLLENDYAHEYSLANTPISNDPKFKALKTNEEIADYFGYEYREKGLFYEEAGMRTFEFYDPKNDTILRFAKDRYNKCNYIDFTNSKSYNDFNGYHLKDILRIYDEAHPNLKVGVDDIEFYKGYSNSPRGFADNFKVEIFDNGLKRGGGQPFDWVLDHELSHLFDDTFLSGIEKAKYNKIASILEKHLDDAKKLDNKYLNLKNIEEQLTIYSRKNNSEEFAELMAATSNLKRGNNFKLLSETKLTLQEAKKAHQHKFRFAEELLEHPEKFKPNWKESTQQKVKNHRKDITDFYKKNNPSGKIRALQSVEGYDKYALTEAENARLKELTIKKEKEGGLKFLDRHEFEDLANRKEFNELRNKILLEGGDPTDYFAIPGAEGVRYEKLFKEFKDWEPLETIEIKPVKIQKEGLFKNKDAFKLTPEEKKIYKQAKENTHSLSNDEKEYYHALRDKVEFNRLHKELLEDGLDNYDSKKYIDLYHKYEKDWNLPELSFDLKFTTNNRPTYITDDLYKQATEFKLTKKESNELYALEKKELIGEKLTSKELKHMEFLQSKDKFAYLNSLRTNGGGLDYQENLEFRKLYKQLKTKLKLDKSILEQPLSNYKSDIPLDKNTKNFKKFRGTTDDGLLPNGEKIEDYFTKDARDMNIREQQLAQRGLGPDYKAFTNFEVDCGRDVKKFEKWIYDMAKAYENDNSLIYYKYYYNKIKGANGKLLKSEAKKFANSIAHDVPVLDDILNNQLKQGMTLWRVQENHNLGNAKVGDIIDFPNFRATAISKEGALWFSGTNSKPMKYIIEIEAPAGTRGAYLAPIKQGTWFAPPEIGMDHPLHGQNYAREMECLLKECKVEVVKIGGRKVKGANGEMLTPIKLRIVGYK